jgi:3-oxoacyl-[acyl-carrier-protein] synthase II
MGAITPLGRDVASLWEGLLAGRSGVTTLAALTEAGFSTDFGGLSPEVEIDELLAGEHRRLRKYVGRKEALALAAAAQAVRQANLAPGAGRPERFGVTIGTEAGRPELPEVAAAFLRHLDKGDPLEDYLALDPLSLLRGTPNLIQGLLAILHDARGPGLTVSTACTSSGQAVGEAFLKIRDGLADVMLTGGADLLVEPFMLTGFTLLGALSTRRDRPQQASRPFDKDRDGFVLADGAGFLVLEELRRAEARGARPLAEVIGYGSSLNAYRITDSPPDGAGALEAMQAALASAGILPQDVDYINAHGTSTKMNDPAEARAIHRLYAGSPLGPPPVSSAKSQLGHLVAACGSVEAIVCARALATGLLPPTINVTELDPEVDLDVLAEGPRPGAIRIALSNSFGFGGSNASLVLRRFPR